MASNRPTPTLQQWLRVNPSSGVLGPPTRSVPRPIAIVNGVQPAFGTPPGNAFTPAQIRHAYGVDQILFGSVQGDGTGQTIAIIDAYHNPNAWADLQVFDQQFGLPDPPSFRQVAQDGSTNYPANAPIGTWGIETSLDVQWAHAMAPGANILLVEGTDDLTWDPLLTAVDWARNQPGVVAISMSFTGDEAAGQVFSDYLFTTPSGHAGVTFLAATGDKGQPGGWPAYSPNVVAVGGTSLTVSGNNYVSETGWSGSGGGISQFESKPFWQNGVVTQSSTQRTVPDVAFNADQNTGVAVYDSYDHPTSPWLRVGGTSLATPMWAGLMAITAQGRALAGLPQLDGSTQTLPALYQLATSDFHDILTGNNGFAAGPGYDLVTGRGTPVASTLVNNLVLVGDGSVAGTVYQDRNGTGVYDSGDVPIAGATVLLDSTTNATATSDSRMYIPQRNRFGISWSLPVSGISNPISHVSVTLSINHPHVSDLTGYLVGPDNTTITLFTGLSGVNLTNTVFDDQSATAITSGSAPYTGTFHPVPGQLAAFIGKTDSAVNGSWTLQVVDAGKTGLLGYIVSWSISITAEQSTTSGTDGKYLFNPLVYGPRVVRQVVPTGYFQASPGSQGHSVMVAGNMTGQDFLDAVPNSICGEVFQDTNGNGQIDTGETGMGGWTVYLDANGNGQLDNGEISQTTSAN